MYNNKRRHSFGGYDHQKRNNFPRKSGFIRSKINPSLYIKEAQELVKIEDEATLNSFSDFNFHPNLLANIKSKGYIKPTQIQDKVIPHITNNIDILGIANTGTGKTAAFVLPLIDKIINNPNKRIIVLTPTRELALQIKEEFRSFTMGLKVYLALAIGGAYIREQIIQIKRGPNVIIGTPGRIVDLGKRNVINFNQFDTVVLDEVDRMLDMGFINDVRFIVDQTPRSRQTLFFSATIDKRVESLVDGFLKNPVKISIKTQDASSHVEQDIVKVPRFAKEDKLQQLVAHPDFKKVLVFGSTQRIVEKLSILLSRNGFNAQGLHGGKRQQQRQRIVKSFRENQFSILVATDVAARGLDITDITHVINYDEPNNYQEYIHRIGRTGRGNNKGFALTFVE
ncbi:MAG: DEAD/DEAH box helicase [Candidatus Shapirobacteria bacterium]|nr:DEAD/DEAH box helicase [Candidatus Shapirobacteria bacterium]